MPETNMFAPPKMMGFQVPFIFLFQKAPKFSGATSGVPVRLLENRPRDRFVVSTNRWTYGNPGPRSPGLEPLPTFSGAHIRQNPHGSTQLIPGAVWE